LQPMHRSKSTKKTFFKTDLYDAVANTALPVIWVVVR